MALSFNAAGELDFDNGGLDDDDNLEVEAGFGEGRSRWAAGEDVLALAAGERSADVDDDDDPLGPLTVAAEEGATRAAALDDAAPLAALAALVCLMLRPRASRSLRSRFSWRVSGR